MNFEAFLAARQPEWKQIESLLDRFERGGGGRLTTGEIRSIGLWYRNLLSDLAFAQSDFINPPLHAYLNRLAGRMYHVLYPRSTFPRGAIWRFYRSGFPALFRRTLPYTAVAVVWFAVLAGLGAWWTYRSPHLVEAMRPLVVRAREAESQHMVWAPIPPRARPYTSSFLVTNNVTVMLMACFTGLTGGLGTLWYVGYNGFIFGHTVAACHLMDALSALVWFVMAHGVLEFSAIFISGGAGLLMGDALWRPGPLTRLDALRKNGQEAFYLLAGSLPIMGMAGVVESYFSPRALAPGVKLAVTAGLALGLGVYLFSGKAETAAEGTNQPSQERSHPSRTSVRLPAGDLSRRRNLSAKH